MVNHWLDDAQSFFQAPNVALLGTTNSAATGTVGTLGTQASQCATEWGVKPTFLLVNFFNVGPAIEAVDAMNGVNGVGRLALSEEILTAATSAGSLTTGGGVTMPLVVMLSMVGMLHCIF